jgi:hypothetical protein
MGPVQAGIGILRAAANYLFITSAGRVQLAAAHQHRAAIDPRLGVAQRRPIRLFRLPIAFKLLQGRP